MIAEIDTKKIETDEDVILVAKMFLKHSAKILKFNDLSWEERQSMRHLERKCESNITKG